MTVYKSSNTGAEIDAAIEKALASANDADLTAAVERIETLETESATEADLTAAVERITTLETESATEADLTIAEGRIADLEAAGSGVLEFLDPVDVATTGNITLSGEQTLDGVLTNASSVLVKDQVDASENGPYTTGAGAWTRRSDADTAAKISMKAVLVRNGATHGGQAWGTYFADTATLDTDDMDWVIQSDASGLQDQIDAKANAADSVLTGIPTAPTAASGTNTTQIATTEYVRGEVGLVPFDADTDQLEVAADADGNLYRRVDATGREYLPHLDASVQDEINLRPGGLASATPTGDIEQMWDGDRNVVRRTDARGALYIAGPGSVQHHMRQSLEPEYGEFLAPVRTSRDAYPAVVKTAVASLQQEALPYIEPPVMLVPNAYDVPDGVLSAITLSDDNPVALLPFPYSTGGSVHPYLLPMRKPLYGYRYLLADSDHLHATASEETPVLFGSNDLEHFDLIPDVAQPMAHAAMGTGGEAYDSYQSDPFLSYDMTDGALIRGTRENVSRPSIAVNFHMSKTYDGIHWTPIETVSAPSGSGLAPAILYEPVAGVWHLWFASAEGTLDHYTGTSHIGPWTLSSSTNFVAAHGIDIWHLEVKYLGDRFALCCNTRDAGTDTKAQVYLGLSSDGDTWTMSSGLVSPQSADIYKPSFFVDFDGTDLARFTFAWSHWDWIGAGPADSEMHLYIQRSAWIDLTTL